MKNLTLVRMVFDINIEKMCDYQKKQFLKAVEKRLTEFQRQYQAGELKADATVTVDLPPTH